jgi:hypothetical protein
MEANSIKSQIVIVELNPIAKRIQNVYNKFIRQISDQFKSTKANCISLCEKNIIRKQVRYGVCIMQKMNKICDYIVADVQESV